MFAAIGCVLAPLVVIACSGNPLSRKYEYEEDVYLALDGSATIYVNASVAALVALRGVDLNPDPRARLDRRDVRALYESPVVDVRNVSLSRRDNRRYVHLRLEAPDVRRLHEAAPFAWSKYDFAEHEEVFQYRQVVGASANRDVGDVGWTGQEIVAIRLHLPSRVPFHNSPTRVIERGNIIVWEQLLTERRAGKPLEIEVHLETESILVHTLILFGMMAALAALTFAVLIWYVMRRGRTVPPSDRQELPPTAA